MRILILGATGMIGSTFFRVMSAAYAETWGTVRSPRFLPAKGQHHLLLLPDVLDMTACVSALQHIQPDVVINATGIVKQLSIATDAKQVMPINAVFSHQLAAMCERIGARLILLSTDCVFSGKQGMYTEDDLCDAEDLYGQSKAMGEVKHASHVLTIRTSTIGHEPGSHHGLLEWFLAQTGTVSGFKHAIFSGIPTVLLAQLMLEYILPNPKLCGVYHVASAPINKYELLQLIKFYYGKQIQIEENTAVVIDRSLNGLRFIKATGYTPLSWEAQIECMFKDSKARLMGC